MKEVTLVTALYDIGRKEWPGFTRSHDYYKNMMTCILSFDAPMVIFIDEKDRDFVEGFREGKKTEVICLPFDELVTSKKWGERISDVMQSEKFLRDQRVPTHPQIKYPKYNILMHEKVQFVKKAVLENYFDTDHYMWIDAGVFHMNFRNDLLSGKFPTKEQFLDEKMHFICLEEPSEDILSNIENFYKGHNVKIIGTTWMGHKDSILKFVESYENLIEESLDQCMMDQDQSFLSITYLRNREICKVHKGGWHDALNMWG